MYGGDEVCFWVCSATVLLGHHFCRCQRSLLPFWRLPQVSAIVIDIGGDTTKSGYAGEDTPKVVFPSSVGVMKGGEGGSGRQFYVDDLNFRRDTMDVMSPLTDGLVSDWDAYSNVLEYTLNKRLRARSRIAILYSGYDCCV